MINILDLSSESGTVKDGKGVITVDMYDNNNINGLKPKINIVDYSSSYKKISKAFKESVNEIIKKYGYSLNEETYSISLEYEYYVDGLDDEIYDNLYKYMNKYVGKVINLLIINEGQGDHIVYFFSKINEYYNFYIKYNHEDGSYVMLFINDKNDAVNVFLDLLYYLGYDDDKSIKLNISYKEPKTQPGFISQSEIKKIERAKSIESVLSKNKLFSKGNSPKLSDLESLLYRIAEDNNYKYERIKHGLFSGNKYIVNVDNNDKIITEINAGFKDIILMLQYQNGLKNNSFIKILNVIYKDKVVYIAHYDIPIGFRMVKTLGISNNVIIYDTKKQTLSTGVLSIEDDEKILLDTEDYTEIVSGSYNYASNEEYKLNGDKMIKSPYETSYGELISTDDTKKQLMKYLVVADKNLNYEYTETDNVRMVFITGKNEEELALPLWEHPLVFEDTKGNTIVASDLRKFLSKSDSDLLNISDVVRDKPGLEFTVLRTLLTVSLVSGEFSELRTIEKNSVSAFSYWLSNSISAGILLDPGEKVKVEIVAQHFYYMSSVDGTPDESTISTAINKIANNKLSLPVNIKTVKSIVYELASDVSKIDDLVANIKVVIGEAKAPMIDTSTVINTIANSWYGPGGTDTIIISMEDKPTWLAMLFSAASNKSYKRTRLATIVDKSKSKIKLPEFTKFMELYIKEHS